MKTFVEYLAYGESKDVKLDGKYLKGFVRAVEGGQPQASAELLFMTDGSAEKTKIRLIYAANETMTEYAFFQINEYTHNNENLVDILTFNYVKEEINKTGVILIERVEDTEPTSSLEKEFK